MPTQPRSSTGIVSRPLLMYCILAIWLRISPTASRTKSANMKSITGRVPVIAAPQARPTNPRSQIGVSQSRTGPYRSNSPVVVAKLPPRLPIPSPITKIRGFCAISSVEGLERRLHVGQLATARGRRRLRTGTCRTGSRAGSA